MLLTSNRPIFIDIPDEEAQSIQRSYKFWYMDYEQGVHMVFQTRYMADRFAEDILGIERSAYSTCKVSSLNGKELGYEILIAAVPIVQFVKTNHLGFSEEGS